MDYSIQDLASKMGFEVLSEDGQYTASYSDAANPMINGVAEIRMEEDGRLFSASLYHRRGDYEADDGQIYKDYEENVEICAMRIGSGDVFRIIHMELDGQTHHAGNQAMIELGLCIFTAVLSIFRKALPHSISKAPWPSMRKRNLRFWDIFVKIWISRRKDQPVSLLPFPDGALRVTSKKA